jgi:hypothetical protein
VSIELSEEQRQAIQNGEPVRVAAPEFGHAVVVLREDQYEALRQALEEVEDRKEPEAFLKASHAAAVAWMKENPY